MKKIYFASISLTILAIFFITSNVKADSYIYRFEDEEGTVHFTDTPCDKRFKKFMRIPEKVIQKDRKMRTTFKLGKIGDPAQFGSIITACSKEYGVDESLIKAVINAESGYNPNAVSNKGATGLMQLMPKTAQGLNVNDAFNPEQNIRGGVRYLRFLLNTFNGDVSLAVAAYNAGLNKVVKYGGIPPYNETQNYVSRVLNYQQSYK
ncbi:MAG: lytic transglycosylase domain-containing protein [Desulfuromonadales bacterium]|nr:lytic transglycosylase domain-containing protein [Desulfuromonadales bacterium]